MSSFGELLKAGRESQRISINKASRKLLIKKDHILALENEDWQSLPEATFVKGYIKSYAEFLGLDKDKMLALYRRDFDERKIPASSDSQKQTKSFFLTPKLFRNSIFALAVTAFIAYITVQYSSVLKSPKLEVIQPPQDITVSVPIMEISGKAEGDSQVAIGGEFVPIDADGNFSYSYKLDEGQNTIEVIASKRLSPKTKITRTVRLIR